MWVSWTAGGPVEEKSKMFINRIEDKSKVIQRISKIFSVQPHFENIRDGGIAEFIAKSEDK